jgi:hypothetical protein
MFLMGNLNMYSCEVGSGKKILLTVYILAVANKWLFERSTPNLHFAIATSCPDDSEDQDTLHMLESMPSLSFMLTCNGCCCLLGLQWVRMEFYFCRMRTGLAVIGKTVS